MSVKKRIAALGGLAGVQEASLISRDGAVIASSADSPTLTHSAADLVTALRALQHALPDLSSPVSFTVEAENGALHVAQAGDSLLLLATTADANLGAVRLEMREALKDLSDDDGA